MHQQHVNRCEDGRDARMSFINRGAWLRTLLVDEVVNGPLQPKEECFS